jgi:hypothetical protein
VQVQQHAGRAIQLARETLGADLEEEFEKRLEPAPSNTPERPDGRRVYDECVKPAVVDLHKVAAHYAVSSLFESYPDSTRVYAFDVEREDSRPSTAGRARLLVGRARFTSRITRETERVSYGVLHLGDHVVSAGVRAFQGDEPYDALVARAADAFGKGEYAEILRALDEAFGGTSYSLRSLFRDEQRRVVGQILESTLAEVEAAQRQLYEHHAPLMRFLAANWIPAPQALTDTARFVLNAALRGAMEADHPDLDRIRATLREAGEQRVELDKALLGFTMFITLRRVAERTLGGEGARDAKAIADLAALAQLAIDLPFDINVAPAQNLYYSLYQRFRAEAPGPGAAPDERAWWDAFLDLGRKLNIRVE